MRSQSANIPIGERIRAIAEERGISQADFGKGINTSKQNVADIYKRSKIDVERLVLISLFLNHDFFGEYYMESPLGDKDYSLLFQLKAEINSLKSDFQKSKETVELLQKQIEDKEKIIKMQEDQIKALKNPQSDS